MLALALLASSALAASPAIPREAWAEPQDAFRTITGFRVRVDVHAPGPAAALLGRRAQQQIERSLRSNGIQLVEGPGMAPALDGTGALVLDVHVIEVEGGTAVAWSLHASQIVHLRTGAFAFASTWEVGDLSYGPSAAADGRLRGTLQPALEELCSLYLAARAAPAEPQQPPPAAQPPLGRSPAEAEL